MSEIIILEAIQAMMREAEDPTCRMCVIVDSHRDFRDRLWPYFDCVSEVATFRPSYCRIEWQGGAIAYIVPVNVIHRLCGMRFSFAWVDARPEPSLFSQILQCAKRDRAFKMVCT